jgi:hypothetical protein
VQLLDVCDWKSSDTKCAFMRPALQVLSVVSQITDTMREAKRERTCLPHHLKEYWARALKALCVAADGGWSSFARELCRFDSNN